MSESILIQLPNKDLWRGHKHKQVETNSNVDISPAPRPFAKIDAAMAAILQASKGAKLLSCLWCGLQHDDKQMREHLKKDHPTVVEPPTEEQILAASKLNQAE
jgi:hypothetical protein